MADLKKLPIGVEYFKDFKSDNFYYVDKTGFINELLKTRGIVNLFTRPRRFGKSLNMDMLKAFFEIGMDTSLFDGLDISKETALCEKYMGKYPVISISLKDINGTSFVSALKKLSRVIKREARRHQYLLESDRLSDVDKDSLRELYAPYLDEDIQQESLSLLSEMLSKHHGINTIILIDEYDVPLDKSYQKNYYPEMAEHIRSIFSSALKTNEHLYFAVITGCLRIAKESIFTGLNNFKVRTISDVDCAEYFGFTDYEVKKMLRYYHAEERFPDFKEWYNGYRFGSVEVYCPWDVINQCDKLRVKKDAPMEPHWENSSSNTIIQDFIENSTEATKSEIEALISGASIQKPLIPELTYTDLDSRDAEIRQTYLWSVLYAAGYLTDADEPNGKIHKLTIPNKEIRGIYEEKIRSWFKLKVIGGTEQWKQFCTAVKNGDAEKVQTLFNEFLSDSISIRDTYIKKEMKENFYHGMLLGLLKAEGGWITKSNAESGIGYTDIKIAVPAEKIGCIFEVKYAEKGAFGAACNEAMTQIEGKNYASVLKLEGMNTIHKYGIACYQKSCKVLYGRESFL